MFFSDNFNDGPRISAEQSSPYTPRNVVDSKIYLKELTTGVKVDEENFSEFGEIGGLSEAYYAKYQYFGVMQEFIIQTDKGGRVYSYYIPRLKGSMDELRLALEEKFTNSNNRPIKFHCLESVYDDSKRVRCTLRHKRQELILKSLTLKRTPDKQENEVHLIDQELAGFADIEKREARRKREAQRKKRAKDDI